MGFLPLLVVESILYYLNFEALLSGRFVCRDWNFFIVSLLSPRLYYVRLHTQQHFVNFLTTFSKSSKLISFPRFILTPALATQEQLETFSVQFMANVIELKIFLTYPIPITLGYSWSHPWLCPSIYANEETIRKTNMLLTTAKSVEVLQIEGYAAHDKIKFEEPPPGVLLPKLRIFFHDGASRVWIMSLIWRAPNLKYTCHLEVDDFRKVLPRGMQEIDCHARQVAAVGREEWFKARSRLVRELFCSSYFIYARTDFLNLEARVQTDQIQNYIHVYLAQPYPFKPPEWDQISRKSFPRVKRIETSLWTWLVDHELLRPSMLPALRCVTIEGSLEASSCADGFAMSIYPTVKELIVGYEDSNTFPWFWYKIFPNVEALKVSSRDALRSLEYNFPNLIQLRHLCVIFEFRASYDWDFVSGGQPDRLNLSGIENLEYAYIADTNQNWQNFRHPFEAMEDFLLTLTQNSEKGFLANLKCLIVAALVERQNQNKIRDLVEPLKSRHNINCLFSEFSNYDCPFTPARIEVTSK